MKPTFSSLSKHYPAEESREETVEHWFWPLSQEVDAAAALTQPQAFLPGFMTTSARSLHGR
ncbi:hypothetical protein [Telluria aromaticivorans]|uniref:Uncharacterized protein n=1 Tax=Telluria aromaticivorans TaxID=2725995 RepID=A0A7Y2NYU5_9BURK|nr:hypothetical protein [Telluria aromaticivorans]NNG22359.1 hypothetical protein [Telluria aromaticivorans]